MIAMRSAGPVRYWKPIQTGIEQDDDRATVASLAGCAAGELMKSLVVEGAGGALVPINDRELMTDLMVRLGLPVVIAARSTLGTINHTLLTIEALNRRSLAIAGVVMVGPPSTDNRDAIERYGCVPVIGEMPMFAPLTADPLLMWCTSEFDRDRRLQEMLR